MTKKSSLFRKQRKNLNLGSEPRNIWIKIYPEQIMTSEQRKYYELVKPFYIEETPKTKKQKTWAKIKAGLIVNNYKDTEPADFKKNLKGTKQEKAQAVMQMMTAGYQYIKNVAMKLLPAKSTKTLIGFFDFRKQINDAFARKIKSFNKEHEDGWIIIAIKHWLDTYTANDDLNDVAYVDPHWHIMIWRADNKRFRIGKATKMLGIKYSGKADYSMFIHKGALVMKNKVNVLTYQIHRTDESQDDGKHPYNPDTDLVYSGISNKEIHKMLKAYQHKEKKEKLSSKDWDKLGETAKRLGDHLGNFDEWVDRTFTVTNQTKKQMKIIETDYLQHAVRASSKKENRITKVGILIWGEGGEGKTTVSDEVFEKLGLKVYPAVSGTGKYDYLTPDDEVIKADDVFLSNALQIFDDKVSFQTRRNRGLVLFRGRWVVATTNDSPDTWIQDSLGLRNVDELTDDQQNKVNALRKRLFICHIDHNSWKLVVDHYYNRGDKQNRLAHEQKFNIFKELFNQLSTSYHKDEITENSTQTDKEKKTQIRDNITEIVDNSRSKKELEEALYKAYPSLKGQLPNFDFNWSTSKIANGLTEFFTPYLMKHDSKIIALPANKQTTDKDSKQASQQ